MVWGKELHVLGIAGGEENPLTIKQIHWVLPHSVVHSYWGGGDMQVDLKTFWSTLKKPT